LPKTPCLTDRVRLLFLASSLKWMFAYRQTHSIRRFAGGLYKTDFNENVRIDFLFFRKRADSVRRE